MEKVVDLLNFMAVLVLSIAIHEMAHAWLADRFGDGTPREHGRMTLNPLAHVHPVFSILIPAVFYWTTGGLLFMGLTPVNPSRMRNPRLHGMLTSLGGPVASLALALAFFLALVAFVAAVQQLPEGTAEGSREGLQSFAGILAMGFMLNIIGAVFNMLPVPPLDGSHVLEFFLPRFLLPAWSTLRDNAWMVFALLMFTGALEWAIAPAMRVSGDLVKEGVALGRAVGGG